MMKTILMPLLESSTWEEVADNYEEKNFIKKNKLISYREIIESGEYYKIASAVLENRYSFSLPVKHVINKMQTGKKKTIYIYPVKDEFLIKAVNRLLVKKYSGLVSPSCYSFQKNKGAKSAFTYLLRHNTLHKSFCLKMDISNYFNSIDIPDFFLNLPGKIKNDEVLYHFLDNMLNEKRSMSATGHVLHEQKGIMAGTPLAPFLSNIYLYHLDKYFFDRGAIYARYSDDIIFFGSENEIGDYEKYTREYFTSKKLAVNEAKTGLSFPLKKWSYLGFAFEKGKIDLSEISLKKIKSKVTRLSRSYNRKRIKHNWDLEKTVGQFIKRLNRKMYGANLDENDLCWARWFFPLLNDTETLREIDSFVQEKLRFSATGKYSKKNYKAVNYDMLKKLNYLPLTSAFYLFKNNREKYDDIIKRISQY